MQRNAADCNKIALNVVGEPMPKIKNMGTSTGKFKEGLIITGSYDSNDTSLVLSGTVKIGLGTNDYELPISDGSANQYIKTDGNGNLTWSTVSASGGSFIQDADNNTKIQTEESNDENKIRFDTAGTERMIIDENGKVGIGTSSPATTLDVEGTFNVENTVTFSGLSSTTGHPLLMVTSSNNTLSSSDSIKYNPTRDGIGIGMNLGGGTNASKSYTVGQDEPQYKIHVVGDINDGAVFATETYANSTGGSKFTFMKARGTPSSPAVISDGDQIGRIDFYSYTDTNNFEYSGMILVTADADGDANMSFRVSHGGNDNEAFYLEDNRVYFVDQVRIGSNNIAPTTNGGASIGGASARFDGIHGNDIVAYDSLKIGAAQIYDQSGFGLSVRRDHTPIGNYSFGEGISYVSNGVNLDAMLALERTGSHVVGISTSGDTDALDEKMRFFGTGTRMGWEWRSNVPWSNQNTNVMTVGGCNLEMVLSSSGGNCNLGIGASSPIAKLDVAGKIAITSESSTPSQPSDGQGYLYTKSDGKLYWRSYDVTETDLTSGGGGSGGAKATYTGYISLQTTARLVSYALGTSLGPTANNNYKGLLIAPFDGTLDTVIVSTKGVNLSSANTGNVTVYAYKNQDNFASSTDVTVAHSSFQQKASGTPNVYSGEFDFSLSISAGDCIQLKVGKSAGSNTDTIVTVVLTES